MKAFIISTCTLLLVFAIVILNYFYVLKVYSHMENEIKEIEIVSKDKASSLLNYWEKERMYVSLSVPHRILDDLEKNLSIFVTKIREGTKIEFEETRQLLLNSIEEMKIHAGISADTLF